MPSCVSRPWKLFHFYPKIEPLWQVLMLHILFLNRLKSPHKFSMRSLTCAKDAWLIPNSTTQIIFGVCLCYVIGPHPGLLLELVQFVFLLPGWLGSLLGSLCPSVWDDLVSFWDLPNVPHSSLIPWTYIYMHKEFYQICCCIIDKVASLLVSLY